MTVVSKEQTVLGQKIFEFLESNAWKKLLPWMTLKLKSVGFIVCDLMFFNVTSTCCPLSLLPLDKRPGRIKAVPKPSLYRCAWWKELASCKMITSCCSSKRPHCLICHRLALLVFRLFNSSKKKIHTFNSTRNVGIIPNYLKVFLFFFFLNLSYGICHHNSGISILEVQPGRSPNLFTGILLPGRRNSDP